MEPLKWRTFKGPLKILSPNRIAPRLLRILCNGHPKSQRAVYIGQQPTTQTYMNTTFRLTECESLIIIVIYKERRNVSAAGKVHVSRDGVSYS